MNQTQKWRELEYAAKSAGYEFKRNSPVFILGDRLNRDSLLPTILDPLFLSSIFSKRLHKTPFVFEKTLDDYNQYYHEYIQTLIVEDWNRGGDLVSLVYEAWKHGQTSLE
jgi:hypothetical protein